MSKHSDIQVVIEFEIDLFHRIVDEHGVGGWNRFVENLQKRNLAPATIIAGEQPEPLGVSLDFTGLEMSLRELDGIDLSLCWIGEANFSGASLRNARLGCGVNVTYRQADLSGADFSQGVEISGCDFSNAKLEGALFDGAVYDPENPPKGLPPDVLARCKANPDGPMEQPVLSDDVEQSGPIMVPVRCRAHVSSVTC